MGRRPSDNPRLVFLKHQRSRRCLECRGPMFHPSQLRGTFYCNVCNRIWRMVQEPRNRYRWWYDNGQDSRASIDN